MAKFIRANATGGQVIRYGDQEFDTVGDVREALGLESHYVANVDGEPATDDQELVDDNYVTFAAGVKGGLN